MAGESRLQDCLSLESKTLSCFKALALPNFAYLLLAAFILVFLNHFLLLRIYAIFRVHIYIVCGRLRGWIMW